MKTFFPVIHVENLFQVQTNLDIAIDCDSDGVFLINHGRMPDSLFRLLVKQVIENYQTSNFAIGVNLLGYDNYQALNEAIKLGCSMWWADNAETDEDGFENIQRIINLKSQLSSSILIFGGVQFKYQKKPKWDLTTSVVRASSFINYITLSGPATGQPANVEDIATVIKQTSMLSPKLALASGVSIENIEQFLPYVDSFLVASSITDKSFSGEIFNRGKLKALSDKIHQI